MSPQDIRDARRPGCCNAPVQATTYRRAGWCQRRRGLVNGRCWQHQHAKPVSTGPRGEVATQRRATVWADRRNGIGKKGQVLYGRGVAEITAPLQRRVNAAVTRDLTASLGHDKISGRARQPLRG